MLGFEKVEAAQACWYTPGRCSTAGQPQEGWSRACLKRRHLWAVGSWEAMKEEVATPCLPSSRAKWLEGRRAWGRGLARGEEVEVQAWKWGWRFGLGDYESDYETWQKGLSWEAGLLIPEGGKPFKLFCPSVAVSLPGWWTTLKQLQPRIYQLYNHVFYYSTNSVTGTQTYKLTCVAYAFKYVPVLRWNKWILTARYYLLLGS